MKTLSKVALIGALSFGSFTAMEMIKPTSEVKAAYSDPFNDEWGIINMNTLSYISKMTPGLEKHVEGGYHNGSWFWMALESTPQRPGTDKDIVKIFRVHENGTLQRYKTMQPERDFEPSLGTPHQVWKTQFNTVYPPGEYIAIAYINGYYSKSKIFYVNQ
ncbi:DUF5065 family protein [Bacillus sp. FSL R10-2789]|uniref:DUF5065 family protein n=1 Tax=Bacillus sp. FSL R10-2789 TaxID=2954662 RepID=UPI0030FC0B55